MNILLNREFISRVLNHYLTYDDLSTLVTVSPTFQQLFQDSLDSRRKQLDSLLDWINDNDIVFYLPGSKVRYRGDTPNINHLNNIIRMFASGNININIGSIPPEIGLLKTLRTLDVNFNSIEKIPPELGQLTNLNELSLESNDISSIPSEIWNLTNLCRLNLSYNNISQISVEICRLTKLKHAWFDQNPIQELPHSLDKLPNLEAFYIDVGSLTIPDNLKWMIDDKIIESQPY